MPTLAGSEGGPPGEGASTWHGTGRSSRAGWTPCATLSRALLTRRGRPARAAPRRHAPASAHRGRASSKATTESTRHPGGWPRTGTATPSWPTSSEDSEDERTRLIALVELARKGDADAFGLLYDHYQASVYRFLYYRTRSSTLAEDLTSETFFRALRSMTNFRWQGKDFGAWLMTIARNLATDHFKAGRTRLEMTTEDMGQHDDATEGPESPCWRP